MKELQRWLDNAPTLRRAVVRFENYQWRAEVEYIETGRIGYGKGQTLTFAVVAAILELESKTL